MDIYRTAYKFEYEPVLPIEVLKRPLVRLTVWSFRFLAIWYFTVGVIIGATDDNCKLC